MNNIIYVPSYKFQEISEKLSVQELAESQSCKASVFWDNKEFVITWAIGKGFGWACLYGNRIENLDLYQGILKPLYHSEHMTEIDFKRRPRGIEGKIIKYNKRKVVMCEQYEFIELKQGQQTTLF